MSERAARRARMVKRLPGRQSKSLDPEDLREVISAYQKCVAETVGRFGGFVAKYMGDGVLVDFGYPQAHEDDAERAVRAGLALVAAVSNLKTYASLQTRVGIATGLWAGGCRRPSRIGRVSGASHYWRDAKPRGTSAKYRSAEQGGHR
jgi:Adenylate and Guanylate cyclase catalytic domain